MELKVQKTDLSKALSIASSVVSNKAVMPILSNILISANEADQITFVGTDQEIGIRTKCAAEVKSQGSTAVPAKKLNDIVRELPNGEIEITVTKNNAVNIKAGKAFFRVVGVDAVDFPKLPEPTSDQTFEIEQTTLKQCLAATIFAISHDETRYTLNGVLVSIKNGIARFVATDGKRLAYIEKTISVPKNISIEAIIPAKAVTEVMKALEDSGVAQIVYSQNQIMFQLNTTTIVSRLIEGRFPNYEQVIPKEEKTNAEVSREGFLSAIRRVSLLTSQESQSIKLDFLKGKVMVSSRTPNLGEAKEELDANVDGDDLTIGFNPVYLMDVLKTLDVEKINISMSNPDKPGLVKEGESYKYVVMPMQLA